jgi:large subunit ribosomal protein L2
MRLIKLKSITNGTRHQLNIQKNLLSKKNGLLKSIRKGFKNQSGHSCSSGRITVRHKGGGCKKIYRKINFHDLTFLAIVIAIEYDPYRSSFISLNFDFINKNFFYSLSTDAVVVGSLLSSTDKFTELRLGFRTLLKNIPTGTIINCLSLQKDKKIKYIRAAGTFGQIIQKNIISCHIKLPSNQIIVVSSNSYATIGVISNLKNNLVVIGKAGRNRLMGNRPSVRGIAMNPVDHPHGGRTNGGRPSVTPWGIPTKGKPTVKFKNR